MRILLIQPPQANKEAVVSILKYPPLGITLLGSILRDDGHKVDLFEAYGLNANLQDVEKRVRRFRPDVVGITAPTPLIVQAFAVVDIVKSVDKGIKTVLGGVHPTITPEHYLSNENVDVIVLMEGEITFPDLLSSFIGKKELKAVCGIGYMKDKKVVLTEPREQLKDLDILPIPAYDMLPKDVYSSPYSSRKPIMTMIRSRGCYYNCIFCEHPALFGKKIRCQSPERSIKEIDFLVDKLNVKMIPFKDSEFTIAPEKNISEFCDLLIERKYDLVWSVNGRVNHVNKDLLRKMKRAGCFSITYGIESGNQAILNILKKGITLQQVEKAVSISKEVGLDVVGNFMIGNPYETKDSINDTISFMRKLNIDYANFAFLNPFPNTELRRVAEEKGWLLDSSTEAIEYEKLSMNATSIPTEELKKYLNKFYRGFYLRPSYILKRMSRLNIKDIKMYYGGVKKIFLHSLK